MSVQAAELSALQKELVREAVSNQGKLSLFRRSDTGGPAVRTRRRKFFDKTDSDVAIRYIAALIQMVDMLLFRKSTSEQYELTNNGWQTASKIGR